MKSSTDPSSSLSAVNCWACAGHYCNSEIQAKTSVRTVKREGINRKQEKQGRILPSHADGYIRPAGPQAAPATKKTRRRRKERGTLREGEIGMTERRFILSGNPWHQRQKMQRTPVLRRPAAQIMYGRVPEFLYAYCGITVLYGALYGTHTHTLFFIPVSSKSILGWFCLG